MEEIRERYRATGGKSPVLEITRALAAKIEARRPVRVFVGLRHWHPFIAEAWGEVIEYGPDCVIGICMAPQFSSMTVGKYLEKLADARTDVGGGEIPVSAVKSWATHPGLVAALADGSSRRSAVPRGGAAAGSGAVHRPQPPGADPA